MAECAFCLQDIADGDEFCPSGGCRQGWTALFGKEEDAPAPDDVYDDERDTLPLDL